jgi:hypothetical protein
MSPGAATALRLLGTGGVSAFTRHGRAPLRAATRSSLPFLLLLKVAASSSSSSSSATMPDAGTSSVAATRRANYALGSRLLRDAATRADDAPAQMVLYADWVTCTQ